MTQLLSGGMTPEEIALGTLEGMSPRVIEERSVDYRCGCSRQRMAAALRSLDAGELRAMAEEDGQAELCCHFCRNRFVFGKEELLEMIAQKTVDSAPN